MGQKERRRIVVTGLGVRVSNGRDVGEFRESLCKGTSGATDVIDFDTTDYRNSRAAVINDLDENALGLDVDRASLLTIESALEAVKDSGLVFEGPLRYRSAVSVGSSLGGMLRHERNMRKQFEDGTVPSDRPDSLYDAVMEVPPSQIANNLCGYFGIRGGNATSVTACSASSNSLAMGMDLIRSDRVDVVLASGVDPFSMITYSGFNILMALSPTQSRPFDRGRNGLMIGEGAGTVIIESYEHAKKRGATIYAELAGYGLSNDAHHPTQPDPKAGGACRAIGRALRDAGRQPDDIDYINAHGTATRYNDNMELQALDTVYGDHARGGLAVSSIKSMIGHTLGAAGTIEAIATVLALHHGFLPPTINFETPEEGFEYDFVPHARDAKKLDAACSHSFGFGGNAACLIFQRPGLGDADWVRAA